VENLRAREDTNVGERDVKFALTGIGLCELAAILLMLFS
jgi:hypothetical protein